MDMMFERVQQCRITNVPDEKTGRNLAAHWRDWETVGGPDWIDEPQPKTAREFQQVAECIAMRANMMKEPEKLLVESMIEEDIISGIISNVQADLDAGKYDNWKPKPMPPLGKLRDLSKERK